MQPAARAALLLAALLCLSACRSLPPPSALSWPERRALLQATEQYSFSGQLAVATASDGFSASLRWQQQGVASDLLLRAPVGVGGARVNFDGAVLRLTTANGTQLEGESAHAELVKLLGFEPPLTSLRFWLLGAPDPSVPSVESLDPSQHLTYLEQADWQVNYSDYQYSNGQWLPQRVSLRRGELRLKLHIAKWNLG